MIWRRLFHLALSPQHHQDRHRDGHEESLSSSASSSVPPSPSTAPDDRIHDGRQEQALSSSRLPYLPPELIDIVLRHAIALDGPTGTSIVRLSRAHHRRLNKLLYRTVTLSTEEQVCLFSEVLFQCPELGAEVFSLDLLSRPCSPSAPASGHQVSNQLLVSALSNIFPYLTRLARLRTGKEMTLLVDRLYFSAQGSLSSQMPFTCTLRHLSTSGKYATHWQGLTLHCLRSLELVGLPAWSPEASFFGGIGHICGCPAGHNNVMPSLTRLVLANPCRLLGDVGSRTGGRTNALRWITSICSEALRRRRMCESGDGARGEGDGGHRPLLIEVRLRSENERKAVQESVIKFDDDAKDNVVFRVVVDETLASLKWQDELALEWRRLGSGAIVEAP